jgi:DNA-nicking Smr family endonuclease
VKPRGGGDDDARAFEEAMRGAKPLPQQARADRVPLRPTAAGAPPRLPRAPTTPHDVASDEAPASSAAFEIVVTGDAIAGRARGVDARLLRKLKAGEPAAEARLDLPGRARAQRSTRSNAS